MTTLPSGADGPAPLRTADGRPPRVAVLVYNDCHNDARVLKECASLRAAGAEVRIIAVARDLAGYGPGLTHVGDGIELSRQREFSLRTYAPALAPLTARVAAAGRRAPAPGIATAAPTVAPAVVPDAGRTASRRPAVRLPAARLRSALVRRAADLGDRAFRSLALGHYWVLAVLDAVAWRPDVVHANDGNTLAPALAVRALTGASIVYDAHELWTRRNVRGDRWLAPHVEAAIERLGVARAAGVISVSPSIVRWLESRYALPVAPTLVRNVPPAAAPPRPEDGRLRELAGLAPDDRVIAYGGRITTSRGLEETLDALALLPEDVHLVMLGYGEETYLRTLGERADALGVAARVHRVGPVAPDEVSTALADGDVSVVHVRPTCLSYEYSLPNKLFESIRAGLPVAAADLPDIREVVTSLGVGRVFEEDEPADLAATLSSLLESPEAYRDHAHAAAPGLVWEHEADQLLALYRRVLDPAEGAR
ncbi:glycosyltransferase [Brachybacterium huguangmaarense]|uniref:Glycosyltransferase n=1 Tax=Brachybacterium huguangmaarense TaxID=1652028 RepID=A0ABY6FY93_9MICO|nr:glycosyltransferase [Brachybacterium huguangmaarense]UYG15684.1 glycosyltransferase [Brachybacterium huguangmaarense]